VASVEHGARQRGGKGYFGWLRVLPWGNPAFSGMALAGIMFAAGGFSGMINAGMNINYLVHNSFWIPGHFHLTVGTAVALTFMAATYWLLPQLTGKPLAGVKAAAVQPYLWFIGMTFMSNSMHRGGLLGIPRRTSVPQYDQFDYEPVFGSIAELDLQLVLGGFLLVASLALFFYSVIRTWLSTKVSADGGKEVIDDELEPALSGPENAPRVLDNLKLWVGIAVLLIVLAYALPFADIASDGIYEGSEYIPVMIEVLLK